MGLNSKQKEAVRHIYGPLLILAGAGSGKTTVLMHRIEHMIKKGIEADNILAVTFTNKAAEEMRTRISKKIGKVADRLWMSTFHSLGVRILRREAYKTGILSAGFTIYDSGMSKDLFKQIIEDFNYNEGKRKGEDVYIQPDKLLGIVSSLKNEMVDVKSLNNRGNSNRYIDWKKVDPIIENLSEEYKEIIGDAYREYQKRLAQYNAVDFDDLILHTIHLFLENSTILEKYQERFRYIMVDEYQDTNRAQYVLMKLLANKHKNLAVVGDDSQSIYAFRGSDIRNILGFEKDYEDAKVVKLEENYRSTKIILDAANDVIAKNKKQYKKKLYTSKGQGSPIEIYEGYNEYDEAEQIAKEIEEQVFKGKSYSDFTILYRNNYQSGVIETVLTQRGVPKKVYGGQSFFDTEEIRDMKAYLQFIENPKDPVNFARIINKQKRGVGKKTVEKILQNVGHEGVLSFLENPEGLKRVSKRAKEGIEQFVHVVKKYRNLKKEIGAASLIERMVKEIDYYQSFAKIDEKKKREKIENVKQLIFIAQEQEKRKGSRLSLTQFLEDIMLQNETSTNDSDVFVKLMTMHASKGLEFPIVFVAGMNEGRFPASYSFTEEDIEEERRLCYVAFTRAEEELKLSYTEKVRSYVDGESQEISATPSRFLDEFEHKNVEWKKHKRRSSYFDF